jgi:endonuclease VIII-like 1
MPELAELAIMADFVNQHAKDRTFLKLEKSPVSKVKTDLDIFAGKPFRVEAQSRGKEMLITFSREGEKKSLLVSMGMSGNMVACDEVAGIVVLPKHAHLRIYGAGVVICLVDTRRFAKWTWKDGFSENRGPCPVKEHEAFRKNFWAKIGLIPHCMDTVPIIDVIMNQSIFNGIGNYLRAEIFHRADVNPFKSFDDLEDEEIERVLDYCKICPAEAYVLGGGQLKDWKNSFEVSAKSFHEWMQMYQKGEKIFDRGKRALWYDKKWKDTEEHKAYVKSLLEKPKRMSKKDANEIMKLSERLQKSLTEAQEIHEGKRTSMSFDEFLEEL